MDDIQHLSFEEAMAKLEMIVKKLEEGKIPLEEAIDTFELGTLLKKHCEEKLTKAQLRIEMIQKDGSIKTVEAA